jgi:hypothetical protein
LGGSDYFFFKQDGKICPEHRVIIKGKNQMRVVMNTFAGLPAMTSTPIIVKGN